MRTQRSREGELVIDERACGGRLYETATVTCSHCQRVVVLNPDRSRPRGYCGKCHHYICDTCDERDCRPARQMFDLMQEAAFRKQHGYADLAPDIQRRLGMIAFRKSIG